MENAGSCALDALFTGNFEHILERIFFSLDYKSFKTCCEVSKTWRERLTSERFRANFHSAISDDERELILASMRGDVRGARRLLSLGLVDVNCFKGEPLSETTWNSTSAFGTTPLHWAAQYGHAELVKLLLDRGANPDSKCIVGRTPLHRTAEYGHTDLVKLLMDRGADPNEADKSGTTPLHWAAKSGRACLVKLLIERGADPDKKDDTGKTPLFKAVEYNQFERHTEATDSVRILLDGGADPNVHAWDPTPLHRAAEFGRKDLVKLLLERGADPNETDGVGSTLLHWAAQFGKADLVRLLMKKGADELPLRHLVLDVRRGEVDGEQDQREAHHVNRI